MKKEPRGATKVTDTFKLHLIEMALHKLHKQLANHDEFKASPGDLIRLIEAHSALQENDGPSEVLVRWIERQHDAPTTDG